MFTFIFQLPYSTAVIQEKWVSDLDVSMQPGRVYQVNTLVVWLNNNPKRAPPSPFLHSTTRNWAIIHFSMCEENQQQHRITSPPLQMLMHQRCLQVSSRDIPGRCLAQAGRHMSENHFELP